MNPKTPKPQNPKTPRKKAELKNYILLGVHITVCCVLIDLYILEASLFLVKSDTYTIGQVLPPSIHLLRYRQSQSLEYHFHLFQRSSHSDSDLQCRRGDVALTCLLFSSLGLHHGEQPPRRLLEKVEKVACNHCLGTPPLEEIPLSEEGQSWGTLVPFSCL